MLRLPKMSLREELLNHLNISKTLPFLFVGTGLSIRYLNLVNWEDLLRKFASQTSQDFSYYRSSANGNSPQIASLIAQDFHDIWWSDAAFATSRERFGGIAVDRESAMKIEVAKFIKQANSDFPKFAELEQELEMFGEVVVDGIITTNWDLLLEERFPTYKVFVGQDALLFSNPQGIGEIYKIHGSCTDPNSLILTSKDYEAFQDRNPYLAAKLITFFVEHPIIFMGYSLQDPNIGLLLNSIAACLTADKVDKLRDKLIFVQWQPDIPEGKMVESSIQVLGKLLPVINITTDSFIPIFEALRSLRRRFPAKILRQLKEQVYDLVQTNELGDKMEVINIEDDTRAESLEVVFGVGAIARLGQVGLQGLHRDDLFNDVIDDGDEFSRYSKDLVEITLPNLIKGRTLVPIFKYLRAANMLDDNGEIIRTDLNERVMTGASKSVDDFRIQTLGRSREEEVIDNATGITSMLDMYGSIDVIKYGALLPDDSIDLLELKSFIQMHRTYMHHENSSYATNFRRLVCLYDILMYKNQRSQ